MQINQSNHLLLFFNKLKDFPFVLVSGTSSISKPFLMKHFTLLFLFCLFVSGTYPRMLVYQQEILQWGDSLPPGWEFHLTPTVHNISIPLAAAPSFEGVPLQSGDYIGVFYLDDDNNIACGGAVQWNEDDAMLGAFGNDAFTPEKDGFKTGDRFIWKIYRHQEQQEYFARVAYNPEFPQSDGKFYGYGLSQLSSLESGESIHQTVLIPEGWSGVSFFIEPHISEVEAMFAPFSNAFVILASAGKVFYPATGTNTIGLWNMHTGYQIKLQQDLVLDVTGFEPASRVVELDPGWNLVPVVSPCAAAVDDLVSGTQVEIIKEVAGDAVYWPAYEIYELAFLDAGKAYWTRATDHDSIIFPECKNMHYKTDQLDMVIKDTPWNLVAYNPLSHIFALPAGVVSASGLQSGDIIGAFTPAGLCVGAAEIADLQTALTVSAFANDTTSLAMDGFQQHEPAQFRMYRPSQQKEGILDVEFDPQLPDQGNFNTNGVSAISAISITSFGVHLQKGIISGIIPNPSCGEFQIILGQPVNVEHIEVISVSGRKVGVLNIEKTTNCLSIRLDDPSPGVYLLKIQSDKGFEVNKLIIK
jgi:hypothetical protein